MPAHSVGTMDIAHDCSSYLRCLFKPALSVSVRFCQTFLLAFLAAGFLGACAPTLVEERPTTSSSTSSDSTGADGEVAYSSPPTRGAVSIVEVYGPLRVDVGTSADYRLRLAPGFAWPIQYSWDFGDGIGAVGNNVTHVFNRPGNYEVVVIARNRVSADTTRFTVRVGSAPALPAPQPGSVEPIAAPVPFTSGDVVWITNSFESREDAEKEVALFVEADFEAAVLPASRPGGVAYYVAVGRYKNEEEALRARSRVLRVRSTPLWLLRLGSTYNAN